VGEYSGCRDVEVKRNERGEEKGRERRPRAGEQARERKTQDVVLFAPFPSFQFFPSLSLFRCFTEISGRPFKKKKETGEISKRKKKV
jgi:hypothetical protein